MGKVQKQEDREVTVQEPNHGVDQETVVAAAETVDVVNNTVGGNSAHN